MKSIYACPACGLALTRAEDETVFCQEPECDSVAATMPQRWATEKESFLRLAGAVHFEQEVRREAGLYETKTTKHGKESNA